MGIDRPTGHTQKLAELDRLIEGRWALINRLFEDVEQLIDERDELIGRDAGLLGRMFGRRQQAPAPGAKMPVRRPEVRRWPRLDAAPELSRESNRAPNRVPLHAMS